MSTQLITDPVTWLSFTDDSIDSYVALDREPFIDRRNGATIIRIGDGVTPGGQLAFNQPIGKVFKPDIVSPQSGLNGIATDTLITASPFIGIDKNGDAATHSASYWEIASDASFIDKVYVSGNTRVSLTILDLAKSNVQLTPDTRYYARVKYVSKMGPHSEWSTAIYFTTRVQYASRYTQELIGPDSDINDHFGRDLDISANGSIIVIGAYRASIQHTEDGAAYIYTKNDQGVWIFRQRLLASNAGNNDRFSSTVSVSGDGSTIVIGAYGVTVPITGVRTGAIYVFTRNPATGLWIEENIFKPVNTAVDSYYGWASIDITIDGSRISIGNALYDNVSGLTNSGQVDVYSKVNGLWVLEATLTPPDPSNNGSFGISVSMDGYGETLLVGSQTNNLKQTAYIFIRSDTTWIYHSSLEPGDLLPGDQFGMSCKLSVDGSTAIISAWLKITPTGTGCVYIYTLDTGTGTWVERQKIYPDSATYSTGYGHSVDISDDGKLLLSSTAGYPGGRLYTHRYNSVIRQWLEVQSTGHPTLGNASPFADTCSMSRYGDISIGSNESQAGSRGAVYIFE